MFDKLFSIPVFLIALAIGLLFVYLNEPEGNIIYVYPTPNNVADLEYKDVAENCFAFKANKIECPTDKSKIKTIPIQESDTKESNNILSILNKPS